MLTNTEKAVVTRMAPQWAWDIIDETLQMDANSSAFDKALRKEIAKALAAMVTVAVGKGGR